MQVTIDGVPYAPACAISSRIGIAITTHQRADVLKRALEQHMKHLPAGAMVAVVDDGSKPAAVGPDGVQLLRHETSLDIVASKNASLSALMDAGSSIYFCGMMMLGLSLMTGTYLTSNHLSRIWLTSFWIWPIAKS
ncbi:hypothetical protein ABR39_23390 [Enterobacter genomosp. O]|nr:hypothetical protein ABR39_23390 [Enterobacter genomosp. O]